MHVYFPKQSGLLILFGNLCWIFKTILNILSGAGEVFSVNDTCHGNKNDFLRND